MEPVGFSRNNWPIMARDCLEDFELDFRDLERNHGKVKLPESG